MLAPEPSSSAEWSLPVWTLASLLLTSVIYTRGWRILHRLLPLHFPAWRLLSFRTGLAAIWLAVASPVAALDDVALTAHMIQHLLFLVIAPPLLLLGSPAMPLLRGLPRRVLRKCLGPLLRQRWLQRLGEVFTAPAFCWVVMVAALLGWHVPAAFEAALRSERLHQIEH